MAPWGAMERSLNRAVARGGCAEPYTLESPQGAAYTEDAGGEPLAGVFNAPDATAVSPGFDVLVATVAPRLQVQEIDLPVPWRELRRVNDAARSWRYIVRGERYSVSDVEPDGDGMVVLVGKLEPAP